MKKTLLPLIFSVLVVANASAVPYSDFNLDLVYLENGDKPYTNEFDIKQYGYDSKTQQVKSATAEFVLGDLPTYLGGGSETVTVSMGGSPFGSSGSFSGLITIGNSLLGSALFDLSEDGIVSYTVTASYGGFTLISSRLSAEAGVRVPDGGFTLTLLGLSLLGILGAQRKFALVH